MKEKKNVHHKGAHWMWFSVDWLPHTIDNYMVASHKAITFEYVSKYFNDRLESDLAQ